MCGVGAVVLTAICNATSLASGADEQIHVSNEVRYLLQYDAPAKEWVEALPLGNGRLGARTQGARRLYG